MAGIGKAIRGIGKAVLDKFKPRGRNVASKKIFKEANTDDGGPYVRLQKYNAKKAKEKGTVYNKSGHAVGTPSKTPGGRTRESIKKYHGIDKDYKGKYETTTRTKKALGGAAILGKKAVKWLWKNRKKVRKDISSPENKKKIKDLTSKFKRSFRKD